ncbi:MAG: AMP-binding protein [Lautropia sp.]
MSVDSRIWQPDALALSASGVAALMRALGVQRYEELLAVSLDDPARYWDVVNRYCSIVWRASPSGYVDLSGGPAFPRWFPDGRLNWVDSVTRWAREPALASRAAIVHEREDGSVRTIGYPELASLVAQFASGLASLGIARGDRVGLLVEPGVEATVSLLALASMGAIVVPLFSGFGVDPIVARLRAAQAGAVIATTGFSRRGRPVETAPIVSEALTHLPTVRTVVWKRAVGAPEAPMPGHDWHELVRAGSGQPFEALSMSADDPFMLIFTSGTTGSAKGVVHTHGGFPLKIAHDAVVHFDIRPADVFLWAVDMGWIAGPLVVCCTLMRGATLVCYDGAPDHPDWSRMATLIGRHGVTHFGAAPTLIRGMAAHADDALRGDVSSVRLLITAGEGIDPDHFAWFQARFGRGTQPVINYTGGTEVSGALLSSVVLRPIPPAGFNTVSPGVPADVVGPDGASVVDAVGELAVRGPFVGMTRSLWQDDERYLDTYWRTIPGLWIHGDLAMRRSDGAFFMRGRSDDTLKVAGKRLGPAEVEEVVLELPMVAEAAAIGVDDPVKGQRLVVFVVGEGKPSSDAAVDDDMVMHHLERRLGRPFRPSRVHWVTQLPKTRSAKIMRRLIRSVYGDLPLGDLSALDNPPALEEIRRVARP